jgi:hypothetical protein
LFGTQNPALIGDRAGDHGVEVAIEVAVEVFAAEIVLMAERRLGDLLDGMELDKGGRPSKTTNSKLGFL